MARPGCGTELTTRADEVDLPPAVRLAASVVPARFADVLSAEAELDTWRIVEVFSRGDLPFDVELSWSSGSGSGARALVTVTRSARVCVFARSLRVKAQNLSNLPHRVGLTVADGFAVTRNVWEHRAAVGPDNPVEAPIPPFAESVRVDAADPILLPGLTLIVRDGVNIVRAAHLGDRQPPLGVPLGGARGLLIESAAPGDLRAVFSLSL
jgi:hypothetical protein